MSLREMKNPEWRVERRNAAVVLRLRVPGSKFGAVEAHFNERDVQELRLALHELGTVLADLPSPEKEDTE